MHEKTKYNWKFNTVMKYVFRLLISFLILYYVLYDIEYSRVGQAILQADYLLLTAAFACTYLIPLCNAWLLQEVLKSYRVTPGFLWLFRLTLITNFYSLFLPGATSGIVKWYKLSRKSKRTEAFNTVAFVRLLDIVVVCNCAALSYMLLGSIKIDGLCEVHAIAAFLSACALWGCISKKIVNYAYDIFKIKCYSSLPGRIGKKIDNLLKSLIIFSDLQLFRILSFMGIALFRLAIQVARYQIIAVAFNISVGYFDLFWILCSVQVLSLLPISVNGLGIREGVLVFVLGQQGVSAELAVSLSLGSFVLRLIMCLTGGIMEMLPYNKTGRTEQD
jgi:uncharacterized protein (TIRG00374 family)